MAKYIDKDALVAEIDRNRDGIKKGIFSIPLTGSDRAFATFEYEIWGKIKDFLDTLDVKEVDWEKEYKDFIKSDNGRSMFEIAKHFFELGMQAGKPITAADRGMAEEIIINLNRVEQDYHINLTKEIEWVRNQVKKGE